MRILITGVAGFVGSSLARQLVNLGFSVTGVDDFRAGKKDRLEGFEDRIDLRVGRLEDILLSCNQKPEIVINCAATAPLPDNESDHYSSLINNVATCGALVRFCVEKSVKKIIHFSSAAVYEGLENSKANPLHEGLTLSPNLMYPVSKYLSEIYLRNQAEIHEIEIFSLRLFNLYGPHQDYYRLQPPLLGYLLKTILNNETPTIYGCPGAQRDYVFIDDLVDFLIVLFSSSPKNNYYDNVNVGSGSSFDVFEIIHELEKIHAKKIHIETESPKFFWNNFERRGSKKTLLPLNLLEREVNKVAFADLSKARSYGLKVNWPLADGLKQCYRHAEEIFR